jgi:hypothetical protein
LNSVREVPLPLPASRTAVGPVARLRPPILAVEYDYEDEDGTVRWARIQFHDVLRFEYRQEVVCAASDIAAYHSMLITEDSPSLSAVRARYMTYLARAEATEEGREFAQYTVYFDDSGCIDVIATSFETEILAGPPDQRRGEA